MLRPSIAIEHDKPKYYICCNYLPFVRPILKFGVLITIFIAGSIFSLLLLSSYSNIVYGQTTSGQTPEQALSSPAEPPSSHAAPSNSPTAQPEDQPQQPTSEQSATPAPLSLPEQKQQEQPTPAVVPLAQTTANGTIDSLIIAPATRWIATGNWTLLLNGNESSFNSNMTWYNNNGNGTHTHELLNFKSSPMDIIVKPGSNILMKGTIDVGTNHRITWKNVHSIINIKGGKTISISLDDKETSRHFAGQAIYGIIKSFNQCSDQPGPNMKVSLDCSSSSSSLSPSLSSTPPEPPGLLTQPQQPKARISIDNTTNNNTTNNNTTNNNTTNNTSNTTNNNNSTGDRKQLDVSILLGKNPITVGDIQSATITVSDANTKNAIPGAMIGASLIEPIGIGKMKNTETSKAHQFQQVTDDNGHASLLFKIKKSIRSGTFDVLVHVSADGYEPKVAATTFQTTKG
jgi:hypothetical protein